ncbi:MAG: 1-acyl-sn-glycerol-3-phosphate acyltransferase [Lachnospiraceae bacterium]|nr:1-acyl-sn-glycerol-3-phosphate acyltransferase [Lachnospiraceae bacterium]
MKATLRRFRFHYVIFLNLYHAPYLILKLKYWAAHPDRYSETQRFMLAKRVIFYLSRTGHIKTIALGRKDLPKEGGYVMFPNHQGKYDALAIMRTMPSTCTVVMDEKKSHTILTSQFLDAIGGKRLEIDNPRQTVKLFNEVAQEIREGRRYIIFPEGGYENENGNELGVFKPGSFKAAIKAKAPIVPVALIDSYRAFNSAFFGPVTVFVHYLKPILYEEYKSLRTPEIAALVQGRIEERIRAASSKEVKRMLRKAQSEGA